MSGTILVGDRISDAIWEISSNDSYDKSRFYQIEERAPANDKLSAYSLPVKADEFQTGSLDLPSELYSRLSDAGSVGKRVWDAVRPGVGAGVGATVGTIAGGALGTLAAPFTGGTSIPAGAYLGGVAGTGLGQMGQDFYDTGAVNTTNALMSSGIEAVGGPILTGLGVAGKGLLRSMGLMKQIPEMGSDFIQAALRGAKDIDIDPYLNAISRMRAKPEAQIVGTDAERALPTLRALYDSVFNQTAGAQMVTPAQAQRFLREAGAASAVPSMAKSGAGDATYAAINDTLRSTGSGLTSAEVRQVLANRESQRLAESNAVDALIPHSLLGRILGGAGLSTSLLWLLGKHPEYLLYGTVPYAARAGYQLGKEGIKGMYPLAAGAAGAMGGEANQVFNPYRGQ